MPKWARVWMRRLGAVAVLVAAVWGGSAALRGCKARRTDLDLLRGLRVVRRNLYAYGSQDLSRFPFIKDAADKPCRRIKFNIKKFIFKFISVFYNFYIGRILITRWLSKI